MEGFRAVEEPELMSSGGQASRQVSVWGDRSGQ